MLIRIYVAALILLVLASGSARAETLERPRVEYHGQLLMEAGRLALSGPVHYTPKRERHSLKLHGSQVPPKIIILRHDERFALVMDPHTKSYYRIPLSGEEVPFYGVLSGPLLEKTMVGSEDVNGIETNRYEVVFARTDGGQLVGDLWLTADNVVMRMVGTVRRQGHSVPFRMQLTELKVGKQPDDIFAPPKDFKLVPASHPTLGALVKPPTSRDRSQPRP